MRPARRSGFTLVELLISMLILAIGIMAVLSMQFTALGGAMLSRDNSNSADVARRVMQVMRAETHQWRENDVLGSVSHAAYPTADSAFAVSPLLGEVADKSGSWVNLFTQPLDARLSTRGAARYCAYARGFTPGDGLFQVQVAVVFPSASDSFEAGGCAGVDTTKLDPEMEPDDENSLQMAGFRVQYFGTQFSRRGFLPPMGTGTGGS